MTESHVVTSTGFPTDPGPTEAVVVSPSLRDLSIKWDQSATRMPDRATLSRELPSACHQAPAAGIDIGARDAAAPAGKPEVGGRLLTGTQRRGRISGGGKTSPNRHEQVSSHLLRRRCDRRLGLPPDVDRSRPRGCRIAACRRLDAQ